MHAAMETEGEIEEGAMCGRVCCLCPGPDRVEGVGDLTGKDGVCEERLDGGDWKEVAGNSFCSLQWLHTSEVAGRDRGGQREGVTYGSLFANQNNPIELDCLLEREVVPWEQSLWESAMGRGICDEDPLCDR